MFMPQKNVAPDRIAKLVKEIGTPASPLHRTHLDSILGGIYTDEARVNQLEDLDARVVKAAAFDTEAQA